MKRVQAGTLGQRIIVSLMAAAFSMTAAATDAYVYSYSGAPIDLGFCPGPETCVVIDFRACQQAGTTKFVRRVFGADDANASYVFYDYCTSGYGTAYFGYMVKNAAAVDSTDKLANITQVSPKFLRENGRHRLTFDAFNGYVMLDDEPYSNRLSVASLNASTNTLSLFAGHSAKGYVNPWGGYIYSVQVYEKGKQVMDLVPTGSPKAGLVDRIGGGFYGPVSGSLSYHAADPDPEPLDWGPVWPKGEKLLIESAKSEVRYFYLTQEVASVEAAVSSGATVELNGMDMSKHLTQSIDGRIAGKDFARTHKRFVNHLENGVKGVFIPHPNFWAAGIRGEARCVWRGSNKADGHEFGGTLVSPRHLLYARHVHDQAVNWFFGADGVVYANRIAQHSTTKIGDDLELSLLTNDVPESCARPAYIMPKNATAWFRDGVAKNIPTLMYDQHKNGNVYNQNGAIGASSSISLTKPTENGRERFYQEALTGCSSSPRFFVMGNDVIVLHLAYYSTSGDDICYHQKKIQSVMDTMSRNQGLDPAAYRLRPYDFTPWMPRIILSTPELKVSGGGTLVVKAPLVWENTLEITIEEGSALKLDPAGCPLSYADRKRVRVNGHYLGLEEDDGMVFPTSVEPRSPEEAGKGYAALDDGVLRLTLFEGANLSELVDASQLVAIRGGGVSNIIKLGAGPLTNDVELADYQGRWEIRRGNLVLAAANALGSGAVEMRSSGSVRFAVESDWENDFSFTSGVDPDDGYSILLMKPTVFNGNVTSTRGLVVKCKNSTGKATFNGAVTLPRTSSTAILYSYPGGYNASGKYDILYRGPVTAYKMDGGTSLSGSDGYVRLYSSQNSIGYLHANYHGVELAGTNCASGAILSMGNASKNINRSCFTVSADNEVGGLTTTSGAYGSGNNAAHIVTIARGAQLTLRARQSFSTDAKFTGEGTLAWQPTYDSYQLSLISNRVHTLSGTIDVAQGRLQLVAGTTLDQLSVLRLSRLAKLTVNGTKALELKRVDYDGDRLPGGLYTPENCPWVTKGAVQVADGPIVRVSKTQDGFRLEVSNAEPGMSVVFAWGTSDGGGDPANWENRSEVTVTSGSATVPYPPGWSDGVSNRARAFILSEGKVISASAVQRPATSLAVTFE